MNPNLLVALLLVALAGWCWHTRGVLSTAVVVGLLITYLRPEFPAEAVATVLSATSTPTGSSVAFIVCTLALGAFVFCALYGLRPRRPGLPGWAQTAEDPARGQEPTDA